MKIYPSVLSCDLGRLAEEVKAVEAAGADGIHFDVMDGKFVPNLTFGAPVLTWVKGKVSIPLDCHLMVEDADILLADFAKAGATAITVHVEACRHLQRTLAEIRRLGCRVGVSINPATDFRSLEWILNDIDQVLSMTVNPGFGGQKLIPAALEKTGELVRWLKTKTKRKIDVLIDGGVNAETAKAAKTLGIDTVIAGQAVFGQSDYRKAIEDLR